MCSEKGKKKSAGKDKGEMKQFKTFIKKRESLRITKTIENEKEKTLYRHLILFYRWKN